MNEDTKTIEDQSVEDESVKNQSVQQSGDRPAEEPSTADIQAMYDELGINSSAPTDKPKKRPKSADVRDKDVSKDDSGDSKTGEQKDDKSQRKSKDAPDTDEDVDSGDDSDSKGKKVGKDSGKVSGESEEADDRVHEGQSKSEEDSKRGSEEDSDRGDNSTGQGEDEQESQEEEGKRPGKSNPKVEQRFQRLTQDVREREERIEELERQLQEATREREQVQIDQEDPRYTIEDFRRVRDENGNVLDLDDDEAELAWRRWQDGYNQRQAEREAEYNRQQQMEEKRQEASRRIMESSVAAYDTLTSIMDEYPELDETSPQFDPELSDSVMPIIRDLVIYQPGTEPGNEEGLQPVIVGMKMNPKSMLKAINQIRNAKRALPLNGANDSVDMGSNVNVTHGRSSDATVNAANELMKMYGINKRF